MARRWKIDQAVKRLRQEKTKLPKQIGAIMLRHYQKSWRQQGFLDGGIERWRPRKRQTAKSRGKAILVQSGALRKSLRVRKATWKMIAAGSYGVKYASRHNRGLDNMPKRQFVGKSRSMTKKIRKHIHKEIKRVFR